MSDTSVQKLAKPQLRGLLRSYLKKHLSIAVALGVAGGFIWKYTVAEPRKRRYAEFYKTYDGDADYYRMKALGILPELPNMKDDDDD